MNEPKQRRRSVAKIARDACLVEDYLAGMSMPGLAARYGITRQRADQIVKREGVHREHVWRLRIERIVDIYDMAQRYRDGASLRALVKESGIAQESIRRALLRRGVKLRVYGKGGHHWIASTEPRACTTCGIVQPIEAFYQRSRSTRHYGDGHMKTCKRCHNARSMRNHWKQKESARDSVDV